MLNVEAFPVAWINIWLVLESINKYPYLSSFELNLNIKMNLLLQQTREKAICCFVVFYFYLL